MWTPQDIDQWTPKQRDRFMPLGCIYTVQMGNGLSLIFMRHGDDTWTAEVVCQEVRREMPGRWPRLRKAVKECSECIEQDA